MEDVLRFEYEKGAQKVYPANWMVKNWLFQEDEKDEATLAHAMAMVAEKNGMSSNDLQYFFPAVLRMLKSDIEWAK
jgi:hypothetical protein